MVISFFGDFLWNEVEQPLISQPDKFLENYGHGH